MHPTGKRGVRISRVKYDAVRNAIFSCIKSRGEVTHTELKNCVEEKLASGFDGSVSWYMESVKLDLEAKGVLVRDTRLTPHRLRLAGIKKSTES